MKMVMVFYESGIDESMTAVLERLRVEGWSKYEGGTGAGRKGLRLNDAIWPGTNNLLLAAMPDERVRPFLDALSALKREYLRPPAMQAYVYAVEEGL